MSTTTNVLVVIEYIHRVENGELFLDIITDGDLYAECGPFCSVDERQRFHDEILVMMRQCGAEDVPLTKQ